MKKKLIVKNVIYSIGTKMIILVLGILIPRLLIISFGSEINGLLSTVTQIFTYLALLEAGIGNSTINALYRPLDENDYETSNKVLTEAKKYYHKVSVIYSSLIILFSIIYPFFVTSNISKGLISGIIVLQGAANFVGYYFTAVYVQLLTASGNNYINNNITFISYVATSIIKIILILLGYNVLVVQIGFFIISLIKIPIYKYLCYKKYPWLNFEKHSNTKYLKERGSFVVHEISTTIFNNTDVFIISTFCSLSLASVYTIYNLVFSSVGGILGSATSGLGFLLGQSQYKEKKEFVFVYDTYSMACICASFVLFTTCYVLIIPFVKLYTAGVSDIEYVIKGLPILFTLINLLSGVRVAASTLITVSGNASHTKGRSIAETTINLVVSVILVNIIGVEGVLWGTIVALLYRSNDMLIYSNRKILGRSPIKEYKNILLNGVAFVCIIYLFNNLTLHINSYLDFVKYGILIFGVNFITFLSVNIICNYKLVIILLKKICLRKEKL